MSGVDTQTLGTVPVTLRGGRRVRCVAIAVGTAYAGYFVAAIAGAPSDVLSPLFSVFMLPVPFVAWWAYMRAPPQLRRLIYLLAWAATLWLVGSLVWYAYYFAGGSQVPEPPGTWDIFLVVARLLVIAAIIVAMRSLISFRIAALDASVICAATVAVGASFIAHGLKGGVSVASLFTLNRPLLGIVTLMLIVSAALGSLGGLPLSIVLLALGEVALTIGSLIYSYQAIQDEFVDDRWAGLAWAGGAAATIVAASVIIAGVDRPVSFVVRSRIPRHPAGSRSVLLIALGGLLLTLGTMSYGLLAHSSVLVIVGLVSSMWIGVAMAFRARSSIRTAEEAYGRLDNALADSERARDQLAAANEELARTNLELRTTQLAMADVLNLADERTHGRMRELIENTGGELAELLEHELERSRRQ
jgi:hypothetical protein